MVLYNAHYVIVFQNLTSGQRKFKGFALIVDSWLFYLLVLGFGFLAIYLMDIGIFKWLELRGGQDNFSACNS